MMEPEAPRSAVAGLGSASLGEEEERAAGRAAGVSSPQKGSVGGPGLHQPGVASPEEEEGAVMRVAGATERDRGAAGAAIAAGLLLAVWHGA